MKRIMFLLGILFIGVIALLETSGKHKRQVNYTPANTALEYDDAWWDN